MVTARRESPDWRYRQSIQEIVLKGEAGIEVGAGMGSRCQRRAFLFQMEGTGSCG